MVLRRFAEQRLESHAKNFRVVVVNGPRQAGKTTLLRLRHEVTGGEFRSLDDDSWLSAALADPKTFVEHAERPLYLDEVQRGGDALIRAIKYVVDLDNERGQFVLSGSTRFLTVPTLSESLAGRVGILELLPLTMAERSSQSGDFLIKAMTDASALLASPSPWTRSDYIELMCTGGFPEVLELDGPAARRDWFASYIATVIGRDIEQFAAVRDVSLLSQTLGLVAARTGSPVVLAGLARTLEIGHPTARDYLSYIETVFLTTRIDWAGNVVAIEVKASQTPTSNDARRLRWLRDKLGDKFRAGIVLHLGAASLSFGDRIFALPFAAMWGHRQLD